MTPSIHPVIKPVNLRQRAVGGQFFSTANCGLTTLSHGLTAARQPWPVAGVENQKPKTEGQAAGRRFIFALPVS